MINPKSSPFGDISAASTPAGGPQSDFSIEIHRGRTEYPSRPIGRTPFLIGAGDECDLRLGGDQVPSVHSRLFIEDDTLHAESLAPTPALFVNGRAVRKTVLLDGDKLGIGAFQFVIHRAHNTAALPASSAALIAETEIGTLDHFEVDDFDRDDLESLSAAELLDRIEKEQAFVDAFENRQRMGARALLNAVRERMHVEEPEAILEERDAVIPIPTGSDVVAADDEENLSAGLQQLLVQLTSLSQALEQRSARLSRREAGYAEAVTLLLGAQEKLATQLDYLSTRLSGLQEESNDKNSTRASA
ncbi:MAG: FHA domain-containing protein [Planctomycetaceae bacterium]